MTPTTASSPAAADFQSIPDMIRAHALAEPGRRALLEEQGGATQALSYGELDRLKIGRAHV